MGKRIAATVTLVALVLLALGYYHTSDQQDVVTEKLRSAIEVLLPQDVAQSGSVEGQFGAWLVAHGKKYSSAEEHAARLRNFKHSLEQIRQHNQNTFSTYELGLTEFADMTHEEFAQYLRLADTRKVMEEECSATSRRVGTGRVPVRSDFKLPAQIDWRDFNGVGPVKNQGGCGSCWTFSSTGAIEAQLMLKTKRFVSLSEQELLDCAKAYDNDGCRGGLPSHAFQYIIENGGLSTDLQYPYEAKDTNGCRTSKLAKMGQRPVKLRSSFNITQYDEAELEVAVGHVGPVSVAFQVADDFRLYRSGVYASSTCKNTAKDVNHAVLAVGYGTSADGTKFWTIKNSWGLSWGEQGYFKMKRGVNMCGVAVCNSFPILA